ncbi:hypothetical protein [Steroidobacter denitrificans]|nr:hypothetical protein [Steroidobacter denitrificans]
MAPERILAGEIRLFIIPEYSKNTARQPEADRLNGFIIGGDEMSV